MSDSGTVVSQEAEQPSRRPVSKITKEQQKKQQRILLILIIVVLAAAVFILYRNGIIGGNAAEKPVLQYLQAIADKDFEAYTSAMPPLIAKDYTDDLAERGITPAEYMELLYSDYYSEFGDDLSIELELTGRSRIDDEFVENFKASYAEIYGEELRISAALEIDVSALFSGSVSTDLIQLECYAAKCSGDWYIVGCDYKTQSADEPPLES